MALPHLHPLLHPLSVQSWLAVHPHHWLILESMQALMLQSVARLRPHMSSRQCRFWEPLSQHTHLGRCKRPRRCMSIKRSTCSMEAMQLALPAGVQRSKRHHELLPNQQHHLELLPNQLLRRELPPNPLLLHGLLLNQPLLHVLLNQLLLHVLLSQLLLHVLFNQLLHLELPLNQPLLHELLLSQLLLPNQLLLHELPLS